ncbi:MAG: hypothetical protein A2406_04155 [Candidatus Komeilibacteria bacterium RIFOXYC1_FULL_37_11]|uniref:D-alanyl-D-alanine dipeptidase n=1 Tax=Candidatus Komeilibacteria bacterium RIFOXYC1_FULL_37_11 TaxID=1798555 RepID=A0A1G2BZH5_9BACT|nr:MAG: hypothetical protein A2406_04155 [Candidatus Komeilibacteria bacterium RIFOXYC1_FULL_37_11]OGY95826.1 MAG: hypothetical protein A2611_03565 [Candidatus Komeilibacteria bacterium RIFOXYD1_FULL_37_29]
MDYSLIVDEVKRVANITETAFLKKWQAIPIIDNREKLLLIPENFCYPFYANTMNITEDKRIFLREVTFLMFVKAYEILGGLGLELRIYDGWRPVSLQEQLYWLYMKQFTVCKFSNIAPLFSQAILATEIKNVFSLLVKKTQEILHKLNRRYVSWPSNNRDFPSPHATGGAVDVWILQNGKSVDLGVNFDSMEESAGAFYHLRNDRIKFKNDDRVCYYRNVLLYAMVNAGFSCYPPEIWHFNYGNQMHALVTKKVANYSYIEP